MYTLKAHAKQSVRVAPWNADPEEAPVTLTVAPGVDKQAIVVALRRFEAAVVEYGAPPKA